MKSHKVSVTVDSQSIQVTPDPLIMTRDDEVHWGGTNPKKFSIVFDGTGPFSSRELKHADATRAQRPRVTGRFKYTVVSDDNPSLRLDPDVVVEDPPSKPLP